MNVTKEWTNKSGIYKISYKDLCYIGSSVDLYNRLAQHISHLRKGNHHSKIMQNYFNKYGESLFGIEVLEYCERNIPILRKLEEEYITSNCCKFNSTLPVTYEHSLEMREKIASTMKKMWTENPHLNPRLGKGHKLWVYTYEGKLLYESKTPEELVSLLGYSNRAVFNNAIRKGRAIIDKKYIVLLNNDWNILYSWINTRNGEDIPVYKLELNGNIIRCTISSKQKVINKILTSPDYIYYSNHKKCYYTFIGLIEKCRLREEIPQIITAELSKEGEIPNLN